MEMAMVLDIEVRGQDPGTRALRDIAREVRAMGGGNGKGGGGGSGGAADPSRAAAQGWLAFAKSQRQAAQSLGTAAKDWVNLGKLQSATAKDQQKVLSDMDREFVAATKELGKEQKQWAKGEADRLRDAQRGPSAGQAAAEKSPGQRAKDQQKADAEADRLLDQANKDRANASCALMPRWKKVQREQEANLRRLIPKGPLSRLRDAEASLAYAKSTGNQGMIDDAGAVFAQRQLAFQRSQRRGAGTGGVLARLGQMAMTTRIGGSVGGGGLSVMPLVGRMVQVLEAIPGPVGAVVKALVALAVGVVVATKHINELANAAAQSGGSIQEVATLRGLGLPSAQIAGIAAGLRERLVSDPMAVSAGMQLGLPPARPFVAGGQDNAKILLNTLDALRKVTNEEERLRLARMLQLDALEGLLRASKFAYEGVKRDAAVAGKVITPGVGRATADVTVGFSRVVANLMTALDALAAPIITVVAPAMNILADVVGFLADAINSVLMPLRPFADAIGSVLGAIGGVLRPVLRLVGGFLEAVGSILGGVFRILGPLLAPVIAGLQLLGDILSFLADCVDLAVKAIQNFFKWIEGILRRLHLLPDDHDATDDNTDAVRENTRYLKAGLYGKGGARTRGAMPSAQGGYLLRRSMEDGSIRHGAFALPG